MAIVNKWKALLKLEIVPVLCVLCGSQAFIQSTDHALLKSLLDASTIESFKTEIGLLNRVTALFDRFPDSRHPIVTMHLNLDRADYTFVEDDAAFVSALEADQDLQKMLTTSLFFHPGRLRAISDARSRWEDELDDSLIRCPVCEHGRYVIESDVYSQLG